MSLREWLPILSRRDKALIVSLVLILSTIGVATLWPGVGATDYTFSTEYVDYGSTASQSDRNAEDGSYETLSETDSASDTDYNSPSKSITYGTEGGTFPDNLQSSDDSYWTLTETSTASSNYIVYLYPDGDDSVAWPTVYPSSPTTHFDKVDETTQGGDGGSTYIETGTASVNDDFTLADLGDPGSGYTLDVQLFAVHYKGAPQPNNLFVQWYIGFWAAAGYFSSITNGAYTNESLAIYQTHPYTSEEWTHSDIDNLKIRLYSTDASPAIRVSQVGVKVWVNFTQNYRADATLTWSSTSTDTDTVKFSVLTEAKTSGESFYLQVWDYTASGWNTRQTVSASSDTSYDYDLTSDERSGTGEVKVRFLDATQSGDTSTADILYLDLCIVRRVDVYYRCSVRMETSAVVPAQEVELRVKGYTSDAETWTVSLWNYTSEAWDTEFTITALSNTWHSTDLYETSQLSGGVVKCRFDNQGDPDKTTASELYLDYVCIRTQNAAPDLSQMGSNSPKNLGETATFWAIYTDPDNDAPSYMRVVIDSTPYDMTKNDSEDTTYSDGCAYYYSTAALTGGSHPYYFATKDASHDEITGGDSSFVVNRKPTLTSDTVVPLSGSNGDTFTFCVIYTDLDNDAPVLIKANIGGTEYDMTKNDSEDTTYSDGCAYHYDKQMAGGEHAYSFRTQDYLSGDVTTSGKQLDVNNKPALSSFDRQPGDPCYPTTQVTFSVVYTDLDNDAPSAIKWRESDGSIQNLTMTETDPGDTTYSDGKGYSVQVYLSHGEHEYDFYATDGVAGSHVFGGDNSITIGNRDPTITEDPGATDSSYRNVYYEYDFSATDADEDTISWEMSTNATFLSIGSSTGLVYGTTSDPLAWYAITVWANDSYSGSDYHYYELSVENREPVISSSANTSQGLGTYLYYHVLYSDPDSDTVGLEFWSEAGFLSLVGDYVQGVCSEGSYLCKLWANDSYGGSDLQQWTLEVSNQIPYFTSSPIYTVANNSAYSYDANATDPGAQELTYDLETNCSWLEVNPSTGVVSGTPLLVGSYYVNVTASDGTLVAYQNYTLQVTNTAPVIDTTPVLTQDLGVAYYYDLNATDANGDSLSYHLDTAPAWLFINEATGEIEGTPNLPGLYEVKAYVWDGYVQVWQNWTINVPGGSEPTPPTPVQELQEGMFDWVLIMLSAVFVVSAMSLWVTKGRRRQG